MKKYTITVQYDNGVVKEHVVRSTASIWFVTESLSAHKKQKVLNMKREFIDKNGNSWEWEETTEAIEAIKNLHDCECHMRMAQVIQKLEAQAPDYEN